MNLEISETETIAQADNTHLERGLDFGSRFTCAWSLLLHVVSRIPLTLQEIKQLLLTVHIEFGIDILAVIPDGVLGHA